MADDRTEQVKAFMDADFLPRAGSQPAVEHRVANALEYLAYHTGQIDKKLDRLIATLEMIARKS